MSGQLGDFIFGNQGSPSQIVDTTPDEFANLRPDIAASLQSLITTGGGPSFQNPLTANMTNAETATLGNIGAVGSNPTATNDAIARLTQTATGSLDPNQNPLLQQMIEASQRPIVERFQEEVVPGLRAQFTQAGQQIQGEGSSPFQMAGARAASGFANALTDASTGVVSGERDRQVQASLAIPQLQRQQVDTMLATLEAQALPRMIEQLGIDRGLEEFRRRQQQLIQVLQMSGNLSSANPAVLPGSEATPGFLTNALSNFANTYTGGLAESMLPASE